jgi:hypothetical protein
LVGDYNGDNMVDEEDYGKWRLTFGQSVSPYGSGADGNWDGVIDAADYSVWRDSMESGFAAASGSFSAAPNSLPSIPEPATAWLAAWLVALLAWRPTSARGPSFGR